MHIPHFWCTNKYLKHKSDALKCTNKNLVRISPISKVLLSIGPSLTQFSAAVNILTFCVLDRNLLKYVINRCWKPFLSGLHVGRKKEKFGEVGFFLCFFFCSLSKERTCSNAELLIPNPSKLAKWKACISCADLLNKTAFLSDDFRSVRILFLSFFWNTSAAYSVRLFWPEINSKNGIYQRSSVDFNEKQKRF